jgi:hypothetical protein
MKTRGWVGSDGGTKPGGAHAEIKMKPGPWSLPQNEEIEQKNGDWVPE